MRPAERLLPLLQMLRRHRRPVTAETLAGELEVSIRTIYRDIAGLIASGVPIRGEAGIGYVLGDGYDLPPLMFTVDEVEALLLGLSFVQKHGDAGLSRATVDARAKIGTVLPSHLKPVFLDGSIGVSDYGSAPPEDSIDVGVVRAAIRDRRKLHLDYGDAVEQVTARTVWPLALGYFRNARILVAWCELRGDFRHFRTDRVKDLNMLSARYPGSRQKLLAEWEAGMQKA